MEISKFHYKIFCKCIIPTLRSHFPPEPRLQKNLWSHYFAGEAGVTRASSTTKLSQMLHREIQIKGPHRSASSICALSNDVVLLAWFSEVVCAFNIRSQQYSTLINDSRIVTAVAYDDQTDTLLILSLWR